MASDNYFHSLGNKEDSAHPLIYHICGCTCSSQIYTA